MAANGRDLVELAPTALRRQRVLSCHSVALSLRAPSNCCHGNGKVVDALIACKYFSVALGHGYVLYTLLTNIMRL